MTAHTLLCLLYPQTLQEYSESCNINWVKAVDGVQKITSPTLQEFTLVLRWMDHGQRSRENNELANANRETIKPLAARFLKSLPLLRDLGFMSGSQLDWLFYDVIKQLIEDKSNTRHG